MKKNLQKSWKTFIVVIILISVLPLNIFAQKSDLLTTIEKIKEEPDKFEDEAVIFKGLITQYNTGDVKTTAYYMVKGDFGEMMMVHTSSTKPKLQWNYKIKGVVKIDQYNSPYVVEINKTPVVPIWIIVIGGVILILIILLVIVMVKNKKNKVTTPSTKASSKNEQIINYDNEFKTVQITKEEDRAVTLIHIPAKLIFTDGADKGKEIRLQGMPSKDGAKISIGSREETGDAKHAHIRIMDPTVSRKQAEIILVDKTKKVIIKNLSTTNYTQVNGEDVLPDVANEIKNNDLLRFGSIEVKFTEL